MATRIADRLRSARSKLVGRQTEIALFRAAVVAEELPFLLLYVFGPGGVGKTTLMNAYVAVCAETDTPVIWLDARNIEATPDSFLNALRLTLQLAPTDNPIDVLSALPERRVLLVDTYEAVEALDGWLRDQFLPTLPENILVVLSGRRPPSSGWHMDIGWQTLMHTVSLRNLSPDDSRTYLQQRSIPEGQHQAVLDFTHGHPLALSLTAELFAQNGSISVEPEAAPNLVHILLERLVEQAPDAVHRAALETCALVHLTTEGLLAELLELPDGHALFSWLRGLSFIESEPHGIFPHDIVREALIADLRWRNPTRYADLHRRARAYYGRRLQETQGLEQQRVLFDYIFLHRDNPVVRSSFQWQGTAGAWTDTAQPADHPEILALIEQHEGAKSAQLAAHWLAHPAQKTLVFRGTSLSGGAPALAGFVMLIALHALRPEERVHDPALELALGYLDKSAPLRPGESAVYFRFWMGSDTYHDVSPIQSLIIVNVIRHDLTSPGLAYTFFPCSNPDFWLPAFSYAEKRRLPEVDFDVDGKRYGVFGHDWRSLPPLAWLTTLAEKELASGAPTEVSPVREAPLLVMSEEDFGAAVRDALRCYVDPPALSSNPLLRSRLVVEGVGAGESIQTKIAALRTMLKETIDALETLPRQARCYRTLYHTYLRPAPTQEQAASLLDLPFSTYRRHLTEGIALVTHRLWQREIGGMQA